jgi:choline dehydrogenase-like flavoprotein
VSRHFDAIIIGTGQAGPSLAARFAGAGMAVAIIQGPQPEFQRPQPVRRPSAYAGSHGCPSSAVVCYGGWIKPWGSTFTFDVTPKASGQWTTLEEAGVYTVKDDKIRREQFFHDGEQ